MGFLRVCFLRVCLELGGFGVFFCLFACVACGVFYLLSYFIVWNEIFIVLVEFIFLYNIFHQFMLKLPILKAYRSASWRISKMNKGRRIKEVRGLSMIPWNYTDIHTLPNPSKPPKDNKNLWWMKNCLTEFSNSLASVKIEQPTLKSTNLVAGLWNNTNNPWWKE